MINYAPVRVDDERLRDRVSAVHQRPRRFPVGPTKPEAQIEIARELVHFSRRS